MPHYFTLAEGDMRELDELSVESLGVVRKNAANAMSPTSKILVVGLGGMGLSSVHELKKTLISRIGSLRDTDIQFLAFDTSEEDIANKLTTGPLTVSETRLLLSPSLMTVMAQEERLRPRAFQDPLPPKNAGYNPNFDGQGAGQVRLTGRLSLMDVNTYHDVTEDLKRAITKLGNFTQQKLEIHVICGVGGGTGSGLCVDMPYIIRHVANLLHVPITNLRMFGHIYLPNVYDTNKSVNHDMAYRNGYAALKEIDYYMNIDTVYETFDAIYPDGAYSCPQRIFDFCTLIGGHISTAIVIDDTKKAAITTCVENLVNQVTHTVFNQNAYGVGAANSSMADVFTSAAFLNNVAAGLSAVFARGNCNFHESGNYKYNYIGSAVLQFPTEAIIEYFTGEIFKKVTDSLQQTSMTLKQADVDEFERGLVSPMELMRASLSEYDQAAESTFGAAVWTKATVQNNDLNSSMSGIVNNIIKKFDEKGDLISRACARAGSKAADIFKNPAKGPIYLARLLNVSSASGGGVVGYYEKLDGYARVCANNIESIKAALEKNKAQRDRLADTMQRLGHFKGNLDNYKELLREIWKDELRIRLYEKLRDNYYLPASGRIGVCYQIRNSLDNAYVAFADMLTYIGQIMANNADAKRTAVFDDSTPGSIFGLTDPLFDALKNSVRHTVNSAISGFTDQDVQNFLGSLLADIFNHSERWTLQGYNPLESSPAATSLRDFIYNYTDFAPITGRTFYDYFQAAYGNSTPAEKSKIVGLIADYLDTQAAPMCNVYPPFTWLDVQQLCHRFMIIPNSMNGPWGAVFTGYLTANNQNILLSPDQNAIYNYSLCAAMPIWIHGDLTKYEEKYYATGDAGVHINESEAMNPPYKDYPPLMPMEQWHRAKQGNIDYVNPHEVEYQKRLGGEIRRALDEGILCLNSGNCYVLETIANRPDDAALDRFFRDYTDDRHNYTPEGLLVGGAPLRKAMKEKFGSASMEITAARSLRADSEDHLPVLIRRQMKLVGKMEDELSYWNGTVAARVEEFNRGKTEAIRRRNMTIYMLYGLVDCNDRGMWCYHLGERDYNIVSRLEVATSADLASYAKFIEMVVCDRFYKLEKISEHLILLGQRKDAINQMIYTNPEKVDAIKERAGKYAERAEQITSALKVKVQTGDTLNNEEKEILDFYDQMLRDIASILDVFSA